MYALLSGSIFDKKCDLVIIPCNTSGGVTSTILNALTVNNIPYYLKPMQPGSVEFYEQHESKAINTALVVGYAASVDSKSVKTDAKYVTNIIRDVIKYCHDNHLETVNIPLLGTGAGHLDAKTSFSTIKSQFLDETKIKAQIFAFSNNVYQELMNDEKNRDVAITPPRVFISYSGNDPKNQSWVKILAEKLRSNGVNARIDIYHLKHGQDLPQWMTEEILAAEKILLICDEVYVSKADSRNGGVGWETMIIQGDMLSNLSTDKYICISRVPLIDRGLPIFVKSRYSFHWPEESLSDACFQELMLRLFDCSDVPGVGEIPVYIQKRLNGVK